MRLLRRGDFESVLAAKAALVRRHFSVHIRPNVAGGARLGVVVARKIVPRAVDRNRIKRLTREAFRQRRWLLGSNDVLIRARRCPVGGDWPALRTELGWLFGEIARLQEDNCR